MTSIILSTLLIGIGVLCLCTHSLLLQVQNAGSPRPFARSTRRYQGTARITSTCLLASWLVLFGSITLAFAQLPFWFEADFVQLIFGAGTALVSNALMLAFSIAVSRAVWLDSSDSDALESASQEIDDGEDQ